MNNVVAQNILPKLLRGKGRADGEKCPGASRPRSIITPYVAWPRGPQKVQ